MYKQFNNIENMSIAEIDAELNRIEAGTANPLRKDENDASDRIKKLAHALMQLGYLQDDTPRDTTLLKIAKILGIDTRSIEPKKVSKALTEDEIVQVGERATNAIMLRALRTNPDVLATASIKDINEALGDGQIKTKRPW